MNSVIFFFSFVKPLKKIQSKLLFQLGPDFLFPLEVENHKNKCPGFYFKTGGSYEDQETPLFPFLSGMLLIGVFQVTEKMEKRNCALCPKDLECSVMYFARSENIAAHENCLVSYLKTHEFF